MIKVAQAMQVMQVPGNRGMLAIDLQGIQSLMTAGIAGGLKGTQRSIGKACQYGAGIIDTHLLHLARQVVHALFDKGLGHGSHAVHFAVEPQSRVKAMGQQVPGDTATGNRCIQYGEGPYG